MHFLHFVLDFKRCKGPEKSSKAKLSTAVWIMINLLRTMYDVRFQCAFINRLREKLNTQITFKILERCVQGYLRGLPRATGGENRAPRSTIAPQWGARLWGGDGSVWNLPTNNLSTGQLPNGQLRSKEHNTMRNQICHHTTVEGSEDRTKKLKTTLFSLRMHYPNNFSPSCRDKYQNAGFRKKKGEPRAGAGRTEDQVAPLSDEAALDGGRNVLGEKRWRPGRPRSARKNPVKSAIFTTQCVVNPPWMLKTNGWENKEIWERSSKLIKW